MREAIKLQRLLIADLAAGRDPNDDNPTITELVSKHIADKLSIAPATRKRYLQSLNWQIKALRIGRLRKQQLQKRHVKEWVSEMMLLPRQNDPSRTLDAYTVRNAFALLRSALNAAGVTPNPCKGVELPDPEDDEIRPMEPAQIAVLLELLDTWETVKATSETRPHRNRALYHVYIRCGLRLSEAIGLRREDVNLERREIRVRGQVQKGKRKKGKTPRAHRTVPFGHDLVPIWRWHFANQASERQVGGTDWNKDGLVFCSENGMLLDAKNVWRQFMMLQTRCGLVEPCEDCKGETCKQCHGAGKLPLFRVHDLRHTYAALAIAAGVDIYKLSRRMGHETIKTTADTYGHLFKGADDDAHAIDRLLKGA
jgi:integrase